MNDLTRQKLQDALYATWPKDLQIYEVAGYCIQEVSALEPVIDELVRETENRVRFELNLQSEFTAQQKALQNRPTGV